jgi:hypothetical protein
LITPTGNFSVPPQALVGLRAFPPLMLKELKSESVHYDREIGVKVAFFPLEIALSLL